MNNLFQVDTKIKVPVEVDESREARIVSVDPLHNVNSIVRSNICSKYGVKSQIAIYTLTSLSYPYYASHEELVEWQKQEYL